MQRICCYYVLQLISVIITDCICCHLLTYIIQALSQSALEVEEVEADVQQMLGEVKRQGQLLSVLSAQRDIKGRDLTMVQRKDKEARSHVRIKELVILDLTKRCNEISNRLKEFSALYEVVKNERNKYVNLIQSSTQGLSEMREKIRILLSEVEILGNESTAKVNKCCTTMLHFGIAINILSNTLIISCLLVDFLHLLEGPCTDQGEECSSTRSSSTAT